MQNNNNNNNASNSKKHPRPDAAQTDLPAAKKAQVPPCPSIATCITQTPYGKVVPKIRGYLTYFNKPVPKEGDKALDKKDSARPLEIILTDQTGSIRGVRFGTLEDIPNFALGTHVEIQGASAKQLNEKAIAWSLVSCPRVHSTELDLKGAFMRECPTDQPAPYLLGSHIFCMVEHARAAFLLKVVTIGRPETPNSSKYANEEPPALVQVCCEDAVGQAVYVTFWGSFVPKVSEWRTKFFTSAEGANTYLALQWARVAVRRNKKAMVDDSIARLSVCDPMDDASPSPAAATKKPPTAECYFIDSPLYSSFHQQFAKMALEGGNTLPAKALATPAPSAPASSAVILPTLLPPPVVMPQATALCVTPTYPPTNSAPNQLAETLHTLQSCVASLASVLQATINK